MKSSEWVEPPRWTSTHRGALYSWYLTRNVLWLSVIHYEVQLLPPHPWFWSCQPFCYTTCNMCSTSIVQWTESVENSEYSSCFHIGSNTISCDSNGKIWRACNVNFLLLLVNLQQCSEFEVCWWCPSDIELNWITLFKVGYVIVKLHNSSHLLKACLNNANRPKIIMTITIKIKQIRILKRTLYVTGQIFLHNDIVI